MRIKNVEIFIILSSCENWVTQISKILIQLDFSHQYNHFEVQHAYVTVTNYNFSCFNSVPVLN